MGLLEFLERLLALPETLSRAARLTLEILRNRLELFSLEAREEAFRLVKLTVWVGALIVFALLTLFLLTFTVVFALPEEQRLIALAAFTAAYLLGAVVSALAIRRWFKRPPPFSKSMAELVKDRKWL